MTDSELVQSVTLPTHEIEATIERAINHCCKLAVSAEDAEGRVNIVKAIELAKQRIRESWPKGQVRGRINVKATQKAWSYETTTEIDMPSSFTTVDLDIFERELRDHDERVNRVAEQRVATNNLRDGKGGGPINSSVATDDS